LPQNIKDYLLKHQKETGKFDIDTKKGPVVATAIIAATMAAKKTSDLIPFCHPIPLHGCDVKIEPCSAGFTVEAQVWTEHRTGVEMEALTAVSIAALTIYDMCKAMSHDIVIEDIHLVSKEGGKRGFIQTRQPSSS
jgi:cyclic pyranopterin monophosphate synthase